jgi:hypothetical protein
VSNLYRAARNRGECAGPRSNGSKEAKGAAKWTRLLCRLFGCTPPVSRHPLNRGCGESGFVTIIPGDAGFVKRPTVNDTASSWEESYYAKQ